MKKIYIYLLFTISCTMGYAQKADMDLSLKLRTDSNHPYFEVVLTNISSDITYTFVKPSDSSLPGYPINCMLVPEMEYKDGSKHEGFELGFFYFVHEGKNKLLIPPGGNYSCNISFLCQKQIKGMLRKSDIGKVKQIRVCLKKFKALKTKTDYFATVDTTLYSNWVNLTDVQ